MKKTERTARHQIVILGAGFAGLYAARKLAKSNSDITIVDRSNHHLFQPLLYQVATGALSPGDIASPVRGILRKNRNIRVIRAEAKGIDVSRKKLLLIDDALPYDTLIVAAGMKNHYFGNDDWEAEAVGLKSLADAIEIRKSVLDSFELAEITGLPPTLVVIGAGPTGVELAGAMAELAHHSLCGDFRSVNPVDSRIILIEGGDRVLSSMHSRLSEKAVKNLEKMGVEVRLKCRVKGMNGKSLVLESNDREEILNAQVVIWAAGIIAEDFAGILKRETGVKLDSFGRVKVNDDLSVPGFPDIFVAGDMASVKRSGQDQVPMVAPAAIQEGKYIAGVIRRRLRGKSTRYGFSYFDKGSLAVIGRNKAVVEVAGFRFGNFFAWLIWIFIHIAFLIGFDNKFLVLFQWSWTYFTKKRGARLIL